MSTPTPADLVREAPLTPEFERGAWFAFDEVLGWINAQDTRLIDKHDLHRMVMRLRPECLWKKATMTPPRDE